MGADGLGSFISCICIEVEQVLDGSSELLMDQVLLFRAFTNRYTLAFDVFGQLYDVFGQRYLCNISRSFLNIEITVTLATGTG